MQSYKSFTVFFLCLIFSMYFAFFLNYARPFITRRCPGVHRKLHIRRPVMDGIHETKCFSNGSYIWLYIYMYDYIWVDYIYIYCIWLYIGSWGPYWWYCNTVFDEKGGWINDDQWVKRAMKRDVDVDFHPAHCWGMIHGSCHDQITHRKTIGKWWFNGDLMVINGD